MDVIKRQRTNSDRQQYAVYLHFYEKSLKHVHENMKRGELACAVHIPAKTPMFPPYDAWQMARLLRATFQTKHSYGSVVVEESSRVFVGIQWTEKQMFVVKKREYKNVAGACKEAIRSYVISDAYKQHRRKSFLFRIPPFVAGFGSYDPSVAARFTSIVLQKQGFVAAPVSHEGSSFVYATWEHV
jgi:hypothetical protein